MSEIWNDAIWILCENFCWIMRGLEEQQSHKKCDLTVLTFNLTLVMFSNGGHASRMV
jgi:hypothetical protein